MALAFSAQRPQTHRRDRVRTLFDPNMETGLINFRRQSAPYQRDSFGCTGNDVDPYELSPRRLEQRVRSIRTRIVFPLLVSTYAACYPPCLAMSVTTIPLQLLDCFRVRVSLESSTTSDFSWNVQTLDRRSTEDSETAVADPYITVDLIRTGTLNSIQIRTSLPPPRSPSTSSLSVSNGMQSCLRLLLRIFPSLIIYYVGDADGSRSSPSNGLGNVATSSTHDSRSKCPSFADAKGKELIV